MLVVFHLSRSEDFLNNRRDTHSALGGYKQEFAPEHAVRKQKHLRAVSEANLLDMEHMHHRPRSRGGPASRARSRSRSRLEEPEPDMDPDDHHMSAGDLINGAFVNHGMDELDHMDHRAGRLGGRKAASQISIASR